jgi:opacity protein-like surface antigen
MKVVAFAALLFAVPTLSYAQDDGTLPISFAEVSAGASFIPTIRTKTYTITDGIDTATGHINLHYDTGLTAGAEVGILGGLFPKIGFSLSYDYLRATFDNGLVVGTVNGTPGSFAFTRSDVASFGLNLDNDVHLVAGNVFFSPWDQGAVHPYLGVGLGAAIISHTDTQLALTATAGVRADISDDVYVGVRYRYYYVTGPTDDLGIRYEGISNHSIMAILGVYLDKEPSEPSRPPPAPPPVRRDQGSALPSTPPVQNELAPTPTAVAPAPLPADLGITGSTVTQYSSVSVNMADPHGAFIANVRSGGAGARAGLQAGDIVITFNGLRVASFDDLIRNVSGMSAGSVIHLGVIRRGQQMELSVQL